MELDLQYDLANLTPANASPVQANFTRIEQFVNQEVIRRDGTIAMVGQLKLAGNPQAPLDALPLQYLNAILPIGIIMMWSSDVAPPGGVWLLADGSLKATADYPELFAVCQYRWGGAGGNFNLPMGNGMVPVSPGGTLGSAVGTRGGSKDAVVVDHTHNANHAHTGTVASTSTDHMHTGSNHGHGMSFQSGDGGDHNHGWTPGIGFWYNEGTGAQGGLTAGTGGMRTTAWASSGNHQHLVSGNTNSTTAYNTGWQSQGGPGMGEERAVHGHTVTVDGNNFDVARSGVTGTGANMPPYVTVPYIVRAL